MNSTNDGVGDARATPQRAPAETRDKHKDSAEISRRAVAVLLDYTGRGPTAAHTVINRDSIMILLRDTLTKGEKSLVSTGRRDHVLVTRRAYQDAMEADLRAAVEECSGRKVVAFLSANHIDPDLASEVFVLEPLVNGPVSDLATADSSDR